MCTPQAPAWQEREVGRREGRKHCTLAATGLRLLGTKVQVKREAARPQNPKLMVWRFPVGEESVLWDQAEMGLSQNPSPRSQGP